ncbi:protein FMC1 homolog [Pecten maximus]|uniref:protein FMC1 homolog n=1 Tax=Pecten maximus TaxID=6579 RepID=UPI001457F189|nr:protein FMC1 homolog [Pecten maximus]XP_033732987.1 protein FMC1 homolog [Pecten maximus]
MASSMSSRRLFQELSKEFKRMHPKVKLDDVPAFNHMTAQFKKFKTTGKLLCRADNEVHYVADSYRCMLQSTRKHEELIQIYGGKGDRSIEESANLVGLNLPKC